MNLSESSNKYEIYYLRRNPFRAIEIAPVYDRDAIDEVLTKFCETIRQEELEFIYNNFIRPALDEGVTINLWIEGEVGQGKSALLIKLWNDLRKRKDVLAIYAPIESGLSSEGFYKGWIKELGMDFFEDLAYRLVRKLLVKDLEKFLIAESEVKEEYAKKLREILLEDHRILRQIFQPGQTPEIKELSYLDKNRIIEEFGYWLITIEGVTTRPLISGSGRRKPILAQFLENPARGFKELFDLYPPRYALSTFRDIIILAHEAGYKMTFIFIDQLDFQWVRAGWSRSKKDKIIREFRNFVSQILGKASIAVTTYPYLTAEFRSDADLMSALPMTPQRLCTLSALDDGKARELIATYLKSERTKEEVPPLVPFTTDAIDEMNRQVRGNVRGLLGLAYDILSKAADEKVTKIGAEYVRSYLGARE